ncbi:hypothetical protein Patl1_34001 [Pistacia atlantica]|uniref:Uncharacterized protein n=1 Tax=Pistacia atlantica TaxID=434234 RepID=A0ACC0ZWJ9_9ROSI|nr:hypothetical protein Patl1_34001 [Pistacia atlantica]
MFQRLGYDSRVWRSLKGFRSVSWLCKLRDLADAVLSVYVAFVFGRWATCWNWWLVGRVNFERREIPPGCETFRGVYSVSDALENTGNVFVKQIVRC